MTIGIRDDLPSDVLVQYGVFVFPSNLEIVGFRTRPVASRDGRTCSGLTHSITIKFHLDAFSAGNPQQNAETWAQANVPTIRTQLMRPADQLVLRNTTFGNFLINPIGGGAPRDLLWGPKPQLLDVRGFYKYGAAITWQVDFCLDPCGGQTQGGILEWNYGLSFGVDRSGYTRRTYAGSISLPMTRLAQTNRTLVDQADRLREQVTPPLLLGFHRETFDWKLSDDKRTLNFTIVDQQMPPNAPPPGCVIAEASHTADTDPRAFVRWQHTLRASYELTTDRNRKEAWNHFLALVKDRIEAARKRKATIILTHLHAGEPEIYGRKSADFSLTYQVIDEGAFATILDRLGLYRVPPQSDWKGWSAALVKSRVLVPRGTANLTFDKSEDVIIDLCTSGAPKPPAEERVLKPGKVPGVKVDAFDVELPDPSNSFLDYDLGLDVQPLDNTTVLLPLPTSPVVYSPQQTGANDRTGYQQPYAKAPCGIVQYRSGPLYVLTLWGRALRAGYDITPPQLVSVGGQAPVPAGDPGTGFRSWVAANYGMPIVAAEWAFRYLLPCPPKSAFTAPPNPLLGGTSQGRRELSGSIARP